MPHRLMHVYMYSLIVRDKYAALFVDGAGTMQQFMWQQDVTGIAHIVKDCFDLLDAPL